MSGYHWFISVLVTLSILQLNTIVRASKFTVPYIPYDNACTRITPAASADDVAGHYRIYYTSEIMLPHTMYHILKTDDYYSKTYMQVFLGAYQENDFISHENPAKPGQMEDYYSFIINKYQPGLLPEPATVSVIVAYHKDIGHGLIECPAKNGSQVSNVFVFGNFISTTQLQPPEKMIDIKEEVMKVSNLTEVYNVDNPDCWIHIDGKIKHQCIKYSRYKIMI
ncbi:hypothetical protein CHUAL_000176 [Chamberlinius hualienensis]